MEILEIGKKYGHLTVLEEAYRDKQGQYKAACLCDCGHIEDFYVKQIVRQKTRYCRHCKPHTGGKPKPDIVGQKINGWDVIADAGYVSRGAREQCWDIVDTTRDFILKELSRNLKVYDMEEFVANLKQAMGYRTIVFPHGGDSSMVHCLQGRVPAMLEGDYGQFVGSSRKVEG